MNIVRRTAATRILAVAAGVLAVGSALTALAVPAVAANKITVTNPGTRTTNPLSAKVSLQIKATDSAKSALSYAATGLPAGLAIGKTTGLISGTITKASSGRSRSPSPTRPRRRARRPSPGPRRTPSSSPTRARRPPTAGNPVSVAVAAADDDKATTLGLDGLRPALGAVDRRRHRHHHRRASQRHVPGHGQGHGQDRIRCGTAFTWKVGDLITVSAPGSEHSTVSVPIVPVKVTAADPPGGPSATARQPAARPGDQRQTGVISGIPAGKAAGYAVTVTAKDGTAPPVPRRSAGPSRTWSRCRRRHRAVLRRHRGQRMQVKATDSTRPEAQLRRGRTAGRLRDQPGDRGHLRHADHERGGIVTRDGDRRRRLVGHPA